MVGHDRPADVDLVSTRIRVAMLEQFDPHRHTRTRLTFALPSIQLTSSWKGGQALDPVPTFYNAVECMQFSLL